jgi:hypothetical protein
MDAKTQSEIDQCVRSVDGKGLLISDGRGSALGTQVGSATSWKIVEDARYVGLRTLDQATDLFNRSD